MLKTLRGDRRQSSRSQWVRLYVEELEGRCLLSAVINPTGGIVVGADGNLWFTEGNRIGQINPTTGVIQEFAVGIPNSAIAASPDGSIWFVSGNQVDRLNPSSGSVDTFNLPSGMTPGELAAASDGTIWMTEVISQTSPGIAGIDPSTGNVKVLSLPSYPLGIKIGPDGLIWVPMLDHAGPSGIVVSINPATGASQEFPTPGVLENALVIDSLGTVWLTGYNQPLCGLVQLKPGTGTVYNTSLPNYSVINGSISIGSDGSLWFGATNLHGLAGDHGLVQFDPTSGSVKSYTLWAGDVWGLTVGPDGNIWVAYSLHGTGWIGRFNPTTGAIDSFNSVSPTSLSPPPPGNSSQSVFANGTTVSALAGINFLSAVATFTPQAPIASPGQAYQVTINWGDGTTSSIVLSVAENGTYDVVASHTYQTPGTYRIKVTIGNYNPANLVGDNPITVFSTANVDPFNLNMR